MRLRYRNGTPLYGKTLQTVLAERPVPRDRRRRAEPSRARRSDRRRQRASGADALAMSGGRALGAYASERLSAGDAGVLGGDHRLRDRDRRRSRSPRAAARSSMGFLLGLAVHGARGRAPVPEPAGRDGVMKGRRLLGVPFLFAVALLGGRLLDLLLARGRRRPRARADAADLPRGGAAVRAHDAHLRRGRRDVPRARRVVHLRPPRVQRAGQLHRRLGDPDRLRDRDRRSRRSRCPTT